MAAIAVSFLAGCGASTPNGPFDVPLGTSLEPGGANFEVAFDRNPIGGLHGFVFDSVVNRSNRPVEVTGYRLGEHPAGARVVRFAVVDDRQTDGHGANFGVGHPDQSEDVDHYPNHAGQRWVVPPHRESHWYIVVVIKKVAPVHRVIRDCWLRYETGGKTYQQDVHCGIQLWAAR